MPSADRLEDSRQVSHPGAADAIKEANGLRSLPDLVTTRRYLDATQRAAPRERWRRAWAAGRLQSAEAAAARALER